jgi:glucokinase
VNLLTPDVVVLGGGLVEAMPDIYLQEVKRSLPDFVMPSLRKSFKVAVAGLGDDATVMGAAALARDTLAARNV